MELSQQDLSVLEELLKGFQSGVNEIRDQAEASYEQAKKSDPSKIVLGLLHFLKSSPLVETRKLAALLFRRLVTGRNGVWPSVSAAHQHHAKSILMNAMYSEPSRPLRHILCMVVSSLAADLVPAGHWNEFLPMLFELVISAESIKREVALSIFADLAEIPDIAKHILPHVDTLRDVFFKNLANENELYVRVGALKATMSTIINTKEKSKRNAFKPLLPSMLEALYSSLSGKQEEISAEVLEDYISLADSHPTFFKQELSLVCQLAFNAAQAESLLDHTRFLSAELLVSLAEAAPGMMKRMEGFTANLFSLCIQYLMDLEDMSIEEWNTDNDDSLDVTFRDVGGDTLDRLAQALGGSVVLPVAANTLKDGINHENWKARHASLMALYYIAEGCRAVLKTEQPLLQAVMMCVDKLKDPNVRVQYAACHGLGQLFTDLAPTIETRTHDIVIPALVDLIDRSVSSQIKVAACAVKAVTNFAQQASADIIRPYLGGLFERLSVLLQVQNQTMMPVAVTAVSCIAETIGQEFAQYYDVFMPYLKSVIRDAVGVQFKVVRGKAMECASLVGLAVGRDRFYEDAKEIMNILMESLHGRNLADEESIVLKYLHSSCARILTVVGQEFTPWLPVVIPALLHSAQLAPEVEFITPAEASLVDKEGWDVTEIDNEHVLAIHTSAREEKINACQMIYIYVNELKEAVFPFVTEIAEVMSKMMLCKSIGGVRGAAFITMPQIIAAVKLAVEKGMAQQSVLPEIVDFILPRMLEAIKQEHSPESESTQADFMAVFGDAHEKDLTVLEEALRCLQETLEMCGELNLGYAHVGPTMALIGEIVQGCAIEIRDEIESPEVDEEEAADTAYHGEDGSEDGGETVVESSDVLSAALKVVTVILKVFKSDALPFFGSIILPQLQEYLKPEWPVALKTTCVYVFDDVIEFCEPNMSRRYLNIFMPLFLQSGLHEDCSLRQGSLYGLGVCADHLGDLFIPFLPDVVKLLHTVISAPTARQGHNESATDNAISALGKICLRFPSHVDTANILPMWLSYLPISGDIDESPVVFQQLSDFVLSKNPFILGADGSNVRRIVQLCAESLGTERMGEKDQAGTLKVISMLEFLQANFGAAASESWLQIPPETRQHAEAAISLAKQA